MKTARALLAICCGLLTAGRAGNSAVVFEITSPYHHIRVIDQDGTRMLSFDGSMETRMSLRDPLKGHFEYTEYFQMPWLWNAQLTNVLMIGLGGGSAQRAYAHYYPHATVTTAEIDPAVVEVAKQFFRFEQTPSQHVHVSDGRVFLRRSEMKYGAILVDAYVANRYGSFIPYHLATKEFFELAASHLATNGVIAYNVIGNLRGWRADLLGAIYKTMKSAFPQVYLFPAKESQNVVIIGTRSAEKFSYVTIQERSVFLIQSKRVTLPNFRERASSFRIEPPPNWQGCPLLTDDFAPMEGLLRTGSQ